MGSSRRQRKPRTSKPPRAAAPTKKPAATARTRAPGRASGTVGDLHGDLAVLLERFKAGERLECGCGAAVALTVDTSAPYSPHSAHSPYSPQYAFGCTACGRRSPWFMFEGDAEGSRVLVELTHR